jgi:tubulin-folding cofactor B
MEFHPVNDIPLLISSANSSSERRVSPAWSIAQFKSRLEPITGIPASAQSLKLDSRLVEAADEESTQLSAFNIQPYAHLQVSFSNHMPNKNPELPWSNEFLL